MKQVVVLLLFNFLFIFSFAQKAEPIYVSTWINKPELQDFSKPLIFLDFWATWCGPCISSMSYTESLEKEFNNDILFFYISNEPSGKIEKFMKKRNLHFFSAVDSTGKNIENFEVLSLPHSILIDYEGNVIWAGKPNEMNKSLLRSFVNLYKGEIGNVNRIKKVEFSAKKNDWDTYVYKSKEVKFIEVDNIANEFSDNNNEYYISGNLKYLVSIMKDVPVSQIVNEADFDKKYMLLCKAKSFKDFQKGLDNFIENNCNISVSKNTIKQKVFFLEQTTSENYFNVNMYNFEKGNNVSLTDDMSVMIDNATVEEAIAKLSSLSGHTYFFDGKDENKYDWNLHYKFTNSTTEQLRDELGFIITEKEKKLNFYTLSNL